MAESTGGGITMTGGLGLRDVESDDLPMFFAFQQDPAANFMAAFTAKDPGDREAFDAHWLRILADPTVINKTVVVGGRVVGSVGKFDMLEKPHITYWVDRVFWGRGIATAALAQFLRDYRVRPVYASAAEDNLGSLRVLEKCGFIREGRERSFANARGHEIDEVFLVLERAEAGEDPGNAQY
ncbi:MAG: GNAT family N-acetyltransferase [Anaerolineales bacterium]